MEIWDKSPLMDVAGCDNIEGHLVNSRQSGVKKKKMDLPACPAPDQTTPTTFDALTAEQQVQAIQIARLRLRELLLRQLTEDVPKD